MDLASAIAVKRPFRCISCRFNGEFRAEDVAFGGIVDLSGGQFEGPVKFSGADFGGPVILGPAANAPCTSFFRPADFSFATFHQGASFESVNFISQSSFRSARFSGDTSFASAGFGDWADFSGTHLEAALSFTGKTAAINQFGCSLMKVATAPEPGSSWALVTFTRASFQGRTDFGRRLFGGGAVWHGASFSDVTEFSQTVFEANAKKEESAASKGCGASEASASFRRVRFEEGASFVGARFGSHANFESAFAGGPVLFDFARFSGSANFYGFTSQALVSLRRVSFVGNVTLDEFTAADFLMDIDDVDLVCGADGRKQTLALIESTAKKRGNLGLANRAKFRRLSLRTEERNLPRQVLTLLFAEWFFGYLVRPLHPFVTLLGFISLATFFRWAKEIDLRARLRSDFRRAADIGTVALKFPSRLMRKEPKAGTSVIAAISTTPQDSATTDVKPVLGPSFASRAQVATTKTKTYVVHHSLNISKGIDELLKNLTTTLGVVFQKTPPGMERPDPEETSEAQLRSYEIAGLRLGEYLWYKVLIAIFLLSLGNSTPTVREIIGALH